MNSKMIGFIAMGALISLTGCSSSEPYSTSDPNQTPSDQSITIPSQPNYSLQQPVQAPQYYPSQQPVQVPQLDDYEAQYNRQKAINSQLGSQSHYGNVSGYQSKGIRETNDYLINSKAKSFDPASAP